MKPKPFRSHSPTLMQQGFTLLEALIALVVVSVGLLGVAHMQLTGIKYNHEALLRTKAGVLAQDMADRMRSNPAADYTLADLNDIPIAGLTDCSQTDSDCDTTELRNVDLNSWWYGENGVQNQLPGADVVIVDPGAGEHRVTITWSARVSYDPADEFDAEKESQIAIAFNL